jgi:hypothetical protein
MEDEDIERYDEPEDWTLLQKGGMHVVQTVRWLLRFILLKCN